MLENREGQKVPNVTFRTRQDHDWVDVTSDEIFKGKTVAVFSLPGAFTPTCSSSHVPRFNELAPAFKQHGVDEIVCISVNDAFVMNEWAEDQDADRIQSRPIGKIDVEVALATPGDDSPLVTSTLQWAWVPEERLES